MNEEQNTQAAAPSSSTVVAAGAQEKNKLMGILAYIGPLVIISYLVAKDDPFVKFHIKQGLVLFVAEIALMVLGMMIWIFWPLLQVVNFAIFVLAVIGIINVTRGEEKELPLVGGLSKYFPL